MKIAITPDGKIKLRNGVMALVTAGVIVSPPVDPDPVPVDPPPVQGNATITLTEPADMRVYQRVGTSKAVPISLTYTGDVQYIEVRAVPVGTALTDTSHPWTPLTTDNGAKTASGAPVLQQGGFYVWQARPAGNSASGVTGTNRFGVGIIAGYTGQSNTVNLPLSYENYPTGDPRAVCVQGGQIKRLGAIVDTVPPNTPSTKPKITQAANMSGDALTYTANMLVAQFNVPVCLIHFASGGKGIDYWTAAPNTGWTNFVQQLDIVGGDMELMYFGQGESSAHAYTSYAAIAAEWDKLYALGLAKTGRTVDTFKILMSSLGPGNYSGSTEGEFGRYRVWQRDFATTRPGWVYAGGAHATGCVDFVHWGSTAGGYLGRVMARNYMHRAFGIGVSCEGPRIVSATRSGLDVTFTVQHAGGTALTDGAGGTGTALTGFRFFDAGAGGAQIGYGATAILSATQFKVTLSALPTGALTADYAITDVPHGVYESASISYVPASTLRDNVPLVNSTVGCLLQPCAAINVT